MTAKKCQTCGCRLIAFQGQYLHPETACNGVKDGIFIRGEVTDEFSYTKFRELYGTPDKDDWQALEELEAKYVQQGKELAEFQDELIQAQNRQEELNEELAQLMKVTEHPVVKFLQRLIKFR